jgi:hypothetical protein
MGAALEFESEGAEQFQDWLLERLQGALILDPGFRVGHRLEDPTTPPGRPLDHAAVHQEQQDRRSFRQRRFRPELGPGQVVLQVEAGVTSGFVEERQAMLVITV